MTGIGGFLPLETAPAAGGDAWHLGAIALASGRACWHAILRAVRPRRVLLPFYTCDAVLQPLEATGTAYAFYALDESFSPVAGTVPDADELMLLVNYFGVMNAFVANAMARFGMRVTVDDTQAFFRRGGSGWSFNSVRKFFGVPDGGYLYGPIRDLGALPPSDTGDCEHLVARLADDAGAWDLFRAHEARIGIELHAMSAVSTRLLASVGLADACRRRRDNFDVLHDALRSRNTIALPLERAACDGPLCYPFLPDRPIDRAALTALGVFVPTFWPELEARTAAGFTWEHDLARRLLPLPIDHRYDADDMRALVRALLQVLP